LFIKFSKKTVRKLISIFLAGLLCQVLRGVVHYISYAHFIYFFTLYFCLVQCGRLAWLSAISWVLPIYSSLFTRNGRDNIQNRRKQYTRIPRKIYTRKKIWLINKEEHTINDKSRHWDYVNFFTELIISCFFSIRTLGRKKLTADWQILCISLLIAFPD